MAIALTPAARMRPGRGRREGATTTATASARRTATMTRRVRFEYTGYFAIGRVMRNVVPFGPVDRRVMSP